MPVTNENAKFPSLFAARSNPGSNVNSCTEPGLLRLSARNDEANSRRLGHIVVYSMIAILTVLVYWNIYQIPFLYSENVLMEKSYVHGLGNFFDWIYQLNWQAILAKPLAVFTFALNYSLGGFDTFGYHLFNLIIHLLNIFFVYLIAQKFFHWPWVCASLFALHPLGTSVVSQLFGRTYSLATFFMLLALYFYFSMSSRTQFPSLREQFPSSRAQFPSSRAQFPSSRTQFPSLRAQRSNPGFSAWIASPLARNDGIIVLSILFLGMILSKQSFIFFPALLLWHAFCFNDLHWQNLLPRVTDKKFIFVSAVILAIIALFCVFYAAPLSSTAVVTPKIFVLSQFGNLSELLSFYFLPFQTALRHELPFYSNLFSTPVLLGISFVLIYITLMFRYKHTQIGFLMGAFLIALLPTNSIFPKDEVILEWRLYPSLVFFALLMGSIGYQMYAAYQKYINKFPKFLATVGILAYAFYLSHFSLSIWQQNQIYQSNMLAWKQVMTLYPYSANPLNTLGVAYYSLEDYQNAEQMFSKATQMDPRSSVYMLNLAKTYFQMGAVEKGEAYLDKSMELKDQYGEPMMTVYMKE